MRNATAMRVLLAFMFTSARACVYLLPVRRICAVCACHEECGEVALATFISAMMPHRCKMRRYGASLYGSRGCRALRPIE